MLTTIYFKVLWNKDKLRNVFGLCQDSLRKNLTPTCISTKTRSKTKASEKNPQKEHRWRKNLLPGFTREACSAYIHEGTHTELTFKVHPVEFQILDDSIRQKVSDIIYKQRVKDNKILEKLCKKIHQWLQQA